MRSITTDWMLSVDLNENDCSLSSLCRNCIRIRISFLVGHYGEYNWPVVPLHFFFFFF
jgi:hypothetical protein